MSATEFHLSAAEAPLFDKVGGEYIRHLSTLRGLIRAEVTRANLLLHLREEQIERAVDVGAGDGGDAAWLASQGITVVMVEPSEKMRQSAESNLAQEEPDVRRRVTALVGDAEDAIRTLPPESFDLVIAHGVLMYHDDARGFLRALAHLAKPGGLLSILTKNSAALAFRPALSGEYASALSLLMADSSDGNLGVPTSAHNLQQLADWLFDTSCLLEGWYGVRVFTDHLADVEPPVDDLETILRLETEASRQDPYRAASRLIHVMARKSKA